MLNRWRDIYRRAEAASGSSQRQLRNSPCPHVHFCLGRGERKVRGGARRTILSRSDENFARAHKHSPERRKA